MLNTKIGKRGNLVIPATLRKKFQLDDNTTVIIEELNEGILIRPAAVIPAEIYSAERKAEFLLSNALDEKDYKKALEEVKKMGIDSDTGLPIAVLKEQLKKAEQSPTVDQNIEEILADVKAQGRKKVHLTS